MTYEVTGDGRAINITYVDTGSVLQTEFNVMLPWSKEVELPEPAEESASVTVINVGREVTCTITVNGAVGPTAHRRGPDHLQRDRLTHRRRARHPHRQHREQPGGEHHAQPAHAGTVGAEDVDEGGEQQRRQEATPPGRSWCRGRTPRPPCRRRTSAAAACAPTTASAR